MFRKEIFKWDVSGSLPCMSLPSAISSLLKLKYPCSLHKSHKSIWANPFQVWMDEPVSMSCLPAAMFSFKLAVFFFNHNKTFLHVHANGHFYSFFIDGAQEQLVWQAVIIRHMLHKCMHHLLHSPWLTTRRSICSLQARTCSSHSLL